MLFKRIPKFHFTFIVSRDPSEIFDVSIFADHEKIARQKLERVIGDNFKNDYKAKVRIIEEQK